MFSIGDDFDVDEDFLESAFNVESSYNRPASSNNSCSSACSTPKPLQDINNIQCGYEKPSESISEKCSKNDKFVNLWNANDKSLFFSKSPQKRLNPRNLLDVARSESPQGLKSEVVTRVSKNVIPRKFPGPAGLLPERTSSTSFIAAEEYISKVENEDDQYSAFEEKEVFSQATNKLFEEPESAWRTMLDELGPHGTQLVSAINLSTIRVKQARFGFKVPFLAVCVQNIDCSLPDPSLLLKDQMDEMHGTLHRDVWEDWKGEIVVGSVLVLRNTGVISAGTSSKRYFLNITAKNITTIYTPKSDSSLKISQIQSVSRLDTSQILEEWEKVMTQTRQQQLGTEPQVVRPLFNTFSPQPQPHGFSASPFRSVSSPVSSSSFRSASPVSIHRPSPPPARPVFRPRVPAQGRGQPLPPFSAPKSTTVSNNRMPHSRMPSPTFSNNNTNKAFRVQQNVSPPQGTVYKHVNSSFKLKSEVFKTQFSAQPKMTFQKPAEMTPSTSREEGSSTMPTKKAKLSPTDNKQAKPTLSIFSMDTDQNKSIVDSVLDGIDTDSFFDDF